MTAEDTLPGRVLSGSLRFPTTVGSAVSAVAAAVGCFVVGVGISETVISWIAPPAEHAMLVFDSPMAPLLEHVKAGLGLAIPIVLAWIAAAFFGWRRRKPTGVAPLALFAALLLGASFAGAAARILLARRLWDDLRELAGSGIVPTISVDDLGHWRWALVSTVFWWMLLLTAVWIRTASGRR